MTYNLSAIFELLKESSNSKVSVVRIDFTHSCQSNPATYEMLSSLFNLELRQNLYSA